MSTAISCLTQICGPLVGPLPQWLTLNERRASTYALWLPHSDLRPYSLQGICQTNRAAQAVSGAAALLFPSRRTDAQIVLFDIYVARREGSARSSNNFTPG